MTSALCDWARIRSCLSEKLAEDVLHEPVSIVLYRDEKLPEEEYEYLPDSYNDYKPYRKLIYEDLVQQSGNTV